MTNSSSRRTGAPAASVASAALPATQLAKRVSGLRLTCLAATIMILVQAALGYGIAQAVTVPSADKGSGIFGAIGRSLASGPVALGAHTGLGLLLILTAISAVIRAILARRNAVLAISVVALLAILAADVTGARFVGTGHDSDSTSMEVAAIVALVCYLVSLFLIRKRRA